MKIEMCESLVRSWLKHVLGCNVTEMNYKVSNSWNTYEEEIISQLYEKIKVELNILGIEIFKNNSNWKQLMRQAEVDVFGVKLYGNDVIDYFAVEVAFHEQGLLYGTKDVTVANVLKKLIRSVLLIYGKFGSRKGQIIFASPKMGYLEEINLGLEKCKEIIDEVIPGNEINMRIIANEEFKVEILEEVLIKSDTIADTSDLFVRSIQLLDMFNWSSDSSNSVQKEVKPAKSVKSDYRDRQLTTEESLDNEHKVAYYLSRFEHDLLFPQYNQTDALHKISDILEIKEATLRQKRDRFDPFCNSIKTRGTKRRGYWQYDKLPPDMQRIYDLYLQRDEKEIREEIKKILNI